MAVGHAGWPGPGEVALIALIVAILTNRNASRSADASEDSVRGEAEADAVERRAAAEVVLPLPPRSSLGGRNCAAPPAEGKAGLVLRNVAPARRPESWAG